MTVEVLMSTYNGEKYIQEQVESILKQTIPVHITVRDDGSKDSTVKILQKYDRINVVEGNNRGSTESFLTLIDYAPETDYYAFSDQDDVWDAEKLEIAVNALENYKNRPSIYSGNTRLVDSNLNFIKEETLNPITTLGSAIVKNYATGCTVVFNRKLMDELKKYHPVGIPFHDWWVNLVSLSVGGVSIYDVKPHMSYRQHGNNLVSGNDHIWKKWFWRLKSFAKPYKRNHMAKEILEHFEVNGHEKEILEAIFLGNNELIKKAKIGTGNMIDDFLFHICVIARKI